MKNNPAQPDTVSVKAATIAASSSLQDNLRELRLSYLLENALPAAEQAAGNGSGHLQFLQELVPVKLLCAMTKASSAGYATLAPP